MRIEGDEFPQYLGSLTYDHDGFHRYIEILGEVRDQEGEIQTHIPKLLLIGEVGSNRIEIEDVHGYNYCGYDPRHCGDIMVVIERPSC